MTTKRPNARHSATRALATITSAALLISCASTPQGTLAQRADREAQRAQSSPPRGSFRALPSPPGLAAGLVTPATDQRASAPLDQILAELTPPPPPQAHTPNTDAIPLYTQGRAALIDDNIQTAIDLLTQATNLDPLAAAAWRDLAEAQRRAGDRFAADAANRKALEANPYERRSLLRLGLDAATRREFTRAIELLSRINIQQHPGDPAERYLVWTALGQSLIESGALAAGTELMSKGMDLPEVFSRPTLFQSELELLYRNRSDAWSAIGDAYVRLDDPRSALRAYQRAASFPSFDPVGLLARQTYALLADQRPSSAAAALIQAISRDGLTLEDLHLQLISYLRQTAPPNARIGTALDQEIIRLAGTLPDTQRQQLAGRIALARAAALPDDQAANILRQRLATAPEDSDAITQLLARTNANNPQALTAQVAALIEASPLYERTYTRTAISLAGGAQSLLSALPQSEQSTGTALLKARLLSTLGKIDEAEQTLTDVIQTNPTSAPAVSALTELLLSQRRFDEASAVIERLDPAAGQPALLAKAHGLASLGRAKEALELLTDAADQPNASATVAYQLGSLNERLGQHELAAGRYLQAITKDPLFEQAHAARIRLFNQTGPLANRDQLFAAVRDLRDAIPSARTLRWLRAQELATAGQYGSALRALRELAEEQEDPLVERALVSVWIATSSADDAEEWIREQLTKRPGDSELIAQLARALAAQGKHQQAADTLQAELDRRPGNAEISFQLESILRQNLGREAEADTLTLRRLENAPPSVAAALQEASVYIRQRRFDDAARTLTRAFENAPAVRSDEIRGSLNIAQTIGIQSQTDPNLRPLAINLLEAIIDRNVELPEPAHRLRVLLLVLSGAPNDDILAALARAYQDAGPTADAAATAAAQSLVQQGRPDDAAIIIETLLSAQQSINPTLAGLWLTLVAQYPNPDSAERLIDLLVDRNAATLVYAETLRRPDADLLSNEQAASEIAHAIAQSYGTQDDNAGSEKLYRVALRYNPSHVMANNNLGYQLLIAGANIDEAEQLIQTAYDADPTSPAVIDSLGWARYLQGIFEDETDDMGIVTREGAVPLLQRAVDIAVRDNDPGLFELRHHLGDAYWRTRKPELAIEQWKAGRLAAQALLENLGPNAPAEVSEAVQGLQLRLDAAESGQPPPLTPLAGQSPSPTEAR